MAYSEVSIIELINELESEVHKLMDEMEMPDRSELLRGMDDEKYELGGLNGK